MPLKFKYVDGCLVKATSRRSSIKFPDSIVQPNDAFTIRQIYDNWRKGRPTAVHPFNAEFDEEGNDFDDSDSFDDFVENPVDISQVKNDFNDAREDYANAVTESQKQKQKQKQKEEVKKDDVVNVNEKKGAE